MMRVGTATGGIRIARVRSRIAVPPWSTRQTRLSSWFATAVRWRERARQRRRLRMLLDDDDFLDDIGRSRAEVLQEATTPFWRH